MSAATYLIATATLILLSSLSGCGAENDATFSEQISEQALVANNCHAATAQSSQKACRPLEGVYVAIER